MTVGELLLTNKEKYTKAFIIENEKESNKAVFTQILDSNITAEMIELDAKDYFMLDSEAIDEIFGNSKELGLNEEDLVLIIGL